MTENKNFQPLDIGPIKERLNAATPGPWRWRGNVDREDPRLVGTNRKDENGKIRFPGAIEVLWSYDRERKADDPEADSYREYLGDLSIEVGRDPVTKKGIWRSITDEEIEERVRDEWLTNGDECPISDRRMCFTRSDICCATDARELAVFEVGRARGLPDDTPRSDPRIYRADIVDVRHPDAQLIAHAPEDIAALVAEVERLRGVVAYLSRSVMVLQTQLGDERV